MTDTNFTLTADADPDDLPRTLRREREARARVSREREQASISRDTTYAEAPAYLARPAAPAPHVYGDEPFPAAVTRFDVPFFSLVLFFLKAVIAAIPALIVLGAMLYFAGQGLQAYFPELVKMKILITFPNG